MELIEWLTSILDEDECIARGAGSAADGAYFYVYDDDYKYPLHIGRDTVLADIAAKRAIIETCQHYIQFEGHSGSQRAGVCDDVLRSLASAYAHRDGFDQSWA